MWDAHCVETELPSDLSKECVLLKSRAFVLQVIEVSLDQDGVGRIKIESNLGRECQ